MKIVAEYVWLGGQYELRSKTRVIDINEDWWNYTDTLDTNLNHFPEWDYDGSSTNQAEGHDSEVILKPCALFKDPFRMFPSSSQPGVCVLVMCATYKPDGTPQDTNNRDAANAIFLKNLDLQPWFGMEQEYFLYPSVTPEINAKPLGFSYENVQGQYYCSVGAKNAFGRYMVEEHLEKCLIAGVKIAGVNAEVAPGQWEYQIGPCVGIEAGDHLWIARYIMEKIGEKYNVVVSLDPKPLQGNWNGSGCHTNFSTVTMRRPGGRAEIDKAIGRLGSKHAEHMKVYGKGNEARLTGKHETADFNTFTAGVADRGASIRIGRRTDINGCGYLEDRRPSSNMDPYLVTSKIFETSANLF